MVKLSFTRAGAAVSTALILTIVAGLAQAQTWYVQPTAEIPLRRGQGSEYKIMAVVTNGTAVSILEENDTWARVATADGREGWTLKRYLTAEPPVEERLVLLQQENADLKEETARLKAENSDLSTANATLQEAIEDNRSQLATTLDEYQKLVNDTADVIEIKNNLEQSEKAVSQLRQELAATSEENNRLKSNQSIKWFLAGGGTLIFGCLVGMISARSKRRRSSLY
ncbi:MAG: TIGR04211 family SH3 domain-containing protein [Desulforhopalus sp.]|jgi:SH3 domain protein|nr:TIGR04211 family SH3 domain-containing protein [Desulforhopalus sp.]